MAIELEHLNVCVEEPRKVADALCGLFDWQVRWEGQTADGGFTVHVGTAGSYLALYAPGDTDMEARPQFYGQWGALNHVGLTVPDLDAAEARIKAAGFTPHSHADYEPGRRFYFEGPGQIEYEVVSYA